MSIEKNETFLFGLIKKPSVELPPGAEEILYKTRINGLPFDFIEVLRVQTPNQIDIAEGLCEWGHKLQHKGRQISEQNINSSSIQKRPGILDFIKTKSVSYTWKL